MTAAVLENKHLLQVEMRTPGGYFAAKRAYETRKEYLGTGFVKDQEGFLIPTVSSSMRKRPGAAAD